VEETHFQLSLIYLFLQMYFFKKLMLHALLEGLYTCPMQANIEHCSFSIYKVTLMNRYYYLLALVLDSTTRDGWQFPLTKTSRIDIIHLYTMMNARKASKGVIFALCTSSLSRNQSLLFVFLSLIPLGEYVEFLLFLKTVKLKEV